MNCAPLLKAILIISVILLIKFGAYLISPIFSLLSSYLSLDTIDSNTNILKKYYIIVFVFCYLDYLIKIVFYI